MKPPSKLVKISNLLDYWDAIFFWAVFLGASILILWLLTTKAKDLIRQTVATQVLTTSSMTATMLTTKFAGDGVKSESRWKNSLAIEQLQVIQSQNPLILGIVVLEQISSGLKVIGQTTSSETVKNILREKLKNPEFQKFAQQAQLTDFPVPSEWSFLAPKKLFTFAKNIEDPEYTFTSIRKTEQKGEKRKIILIIFDAQKIQNQFFEIDETTVTILSISIILASLLSWLIQKRSWQRQAAQKGELAAVNLLNQRDAILKTIVSTMDDVLLNKQFEHAIDKLLLKIGYELKLKYSYICLNPLYTRVTEKDLVGKIVSDQTVPFSWEDLSKLNSDTQNKLLKDGGIVALYANALLFEDSAVVKKSKLQAMVLIPILIGQSPLGVLVLGDQAEREIWDLGLLDSLKFIAEIYATAYDRREADQKFLESSKIQVLGKMAGGVAHEFNNLLHIISGNLDRILKRDQIPNEDKTLIHKILEASKRGSKIVEQLLGTTRQMAPDVKASPLNELVKRTLDLFQPVLNKSTLVQLELDKTLPLALFDESKIQQVILNLLLNANDAISQDGLITVKTLVKNYVIEGESSSFVCCQIADNGSGIAEKDMKLLFDPFFTTKGPGLGTGLGLSTSKGILIQQNGFIEVSNLEKGGALFAFYLPVATQVLLDSEQVNTTEQNLVETIELTRKGHVLIADDEALCRDVLSAILTDFGYTFSVAGDGRELLRLIKDSPEVNWIVTDWTMPGIHGVELMRKIRNVLPAVRIIVASGFALNIDDNLDIHAVILKPFGAEDLLKAMKN